MQRPYQLRPELFSAQPDILKYANHVADKLDLTYQQMQKYEAGANRVLELMADNYISIFCALLDNLADGIEISYNSAVCSSLITSVKEKSRKDSDFQSVGFTIQFYRVFGIRPT